MPAVKSYRRTPAQRKKVQRTSLQALGVRRLTSGFVMLGLFSLLTWGYFHASFLFSEMTDSLQMLSARIGFTLEDVIVEGRKKTDKTQILETLDLERGKPLFSISLMEAKTRLETLPWVKATRVERRFPHTLFIRILEKDPIALWQNQAKVYLVDRDGDLVEIHDTAKYKNLFVVTGPHAPKELGSLIALLEKYPEIKPRIKAATHLRSRRWDILLTNGVLVKLPEKKVAQAVQYLLSLERHHHLKDKDIQMIDMRLPDRVILRLTPEAIQKKGGSGHDARMEFIANA